MLCAFGVMDKKQKDDCNLVLPSSLATVECYVWSCFQMHLCAIGV